MFAHARRRLTLTLHRHVRGSDYRLQPCFPGPHGDRARSPTSIFRPIRRASRRPRSLTTRQSSASGSRSWSADLVAIVSRRHWRLGLSQRERSRPIREAHERQRRFVADASHEMRTPLTVIRATTDNALRADAPRTSTSTRRSRRSPSPRPISLALLTSRSPHTGAERRRARHASIRNRSTCRSLLPSVSACALLPRTRIAQ